MAHEFVLLAGFPVPYMPFPLPSFPVTRGETSSHAHAYTRISAAAAVFASTITTPSEVTAIYNSPPAVATKCGSNPAAFSHLFQQ